jgi:hypothetical protein
MWYVCRSLQMKAMKLLRINGSSQKTVVIVEQQPLKRYRVKSDCTISWHSSAMFIDNFLNASAMYWPKASKSSPPSSEAGCCTIWFIWRSFCTADNNSVRRGLPPDDTFRAGRVKYAEFLGVFWALELTNLVKKSRFLLFQWFCGQYRYFLLPVKSCVASVAWVS